MPNLYTHVFSNLSRIQCCLPAKIIEHLKVLAFHHNSSSQNRFGGDDGVQSETIANVIFHYRSYIQHRRNISIGIPLNLSGKCNEVPKWSGVTVSQLIYIQQ